MNNLISIKYVLLAFILLFNPVSPLQADGDHIAARKLLESGKIKPLDDILKIVKQKHPGKLLEVELEIEDKLIVYEVEILTGSGIVKEIYINAKTGKIISAEVD